MVDPTIERHIYNRALELFNLQEEIRKIPWIISRGSSRRLHDESERGCSHLHGCTRVRACEREGTRDRSRTPRTQ